MRLRRLDLRHPDFQGSSGGELAGARLGGARLGGARLGGARLGGARLGGARHARPDARWHTTASARPSRTVPARRERGSRTGRVTRDVSRQ
ncbi:pentapeptide repeat-containing protein [Streptosporangium sp. 'caverna']|uniref:pentapeptide repeat-containing protein n=1 Tax=Streptosporangium sp. 'caverna' TaxID=2202249 RepID=UPI000D7D2CC7|nr:hypothetical protein DKM19_43640 [Streptosporangium sp. 'caverna']